MKVATHLIFAECCGFATSAIFGVHYETPSVLIAAATSVLPDADYPKSWLGYQLGSVSEELHRYFGHRSFLHSFFALVLVTVILGLPLWWIFGRPAPMVAVFVGYGSHLLADMMTLGGVQLFWPSKAIAVFPGRDEYRVVSGCPSERVFVVIALVLALLFYPVSRVGFDGLIYRLGGADDVYGRVTETIDGDTVKVEVFNQTQPIRLIGVDTPETVAPDKPVGCYGKRASGYTKEILYERKTNDEGKVTRQGRLVKLKIPRIGDSEDAYGRTLAYIYLDTNKDGSYEHLYNDDLIELGLARTTDFSHAHRREFERLEDEAKERGAGLWSVCPAVDGS